MLELLSGHSLRAGTRTAGGGGGIMEIEINNRMPLTNAFYGNVHLYIVLFTLLEMTTYAKLRINEDLEKKNIKSLWHCSGTTDSVGNQSE